MLRERRVSTSGRAGRPIVMLAVVSIVCAVPARPQELLERVVARVNGLTITLSDARVAAGLGLVEIKSGDAPLAAAARGLIDRQLMLAEVSRFSPPEPAADALGRELAALEARVGSRAKLDALMRSTGLNETRIRELARDSLRIQAYIDLRFGASVQPARLEQWVRDLRRRANITCQIPGC